MIPWLEVCLRIERCGEYRFVGSCGPGESKMERVSSWIRAVSWGCLSVQVWYILKTSVDLRVLCVEGGAG